MELDHAFVFVRDRAEAEATVARLGLQETYRRVHPGQGTENICCAFDNAYLELLWLTDAAEATAARIARMHLLERSRWQSHGTCPVGIAWRGALPAKVETWPYRPPYLPDGMHIDVLTASDAPTQPLVFSFPGTTAPEGWSAERRGRVQQEAGYGRIQGIRMWTREPVPADLQSVLTACGVTVEQAPAWRVDVAVGTTGGETVVLRLL